MLRLIIFRRVHEKAVLPQNEPEIGAPRKKAQRFAGGVTPIDSRSFFMRHQRTIDQDGAMSLMRKVAQRGAERLCRKMKIRGTMEATHRICRGWKSEHNA